MLSRPPQTIDDIHVFRGAGPYGTWQEPFGAVAESLVQRVHYWNWRGYTPATFPNDTNFSWQYPNKAANSGVYMFNSMSFGDYLSTLPPAPITPKKVNAITQMVCAHDLLISSPNLDSFDVIYDYFLTDLPGTSGGGQTRLFEISVWMHTPTWSTSFFNTGAAIGNVTISGVLWKTCLLAGAIPYIMVQPVDGLDRLSLTFDFKALHTYLIGQGTITGNEYFNGLALGAEARTGGGNMSVKKFSGVYS